MQSALYKIGYSSLKQFNCIEGTHIKIMCPSVLVGILVFFKDLKLLTFCRYFLMNDEGVFVRYTYLF